VTEAHELFEKLQERVMAGEMPASEWVIDQHRAQFGTDYRMETDGEHPTPELRQQSPISS
jgi:hypothetical protein